MNIEEFRTELLLDLTKTIAAGVFDGHEYTWEALPCISDFKRRLGPTLDKNEYEQRGFRVMQKDTGRQIFRPGG